MTVFLVQVQHSWSNQLDMNLKPAQNNKVFMARYRDTAANLHEVSFLSNQNCPNCHWDAQVCAMRVLHPSPSELGNPVKSRT